MNYIERYWRDATPQDATKEPPMVARFRDSNCPWKINTLRGVRQGVKFPWFSESKGSFQHCQVYDAPDPGEGWRLIDPEKESPEEGDEFFEHGYWKTRRAKTDPFAKTFYYRRRIEQPKPQYVPFAWEDREQLRGRWICRSKDGNIIEEIASKFDSRVFNQVAKHLLEDGWKFLDTGKPVGKEVAQ